MADEKTWLDSVRITEWVDASTLRLSRSFALPRVGILRIFVEQFRNFPIRETTEATVAIDRESDPVHFLRLFSAGLAEFESPDRWVTSEGRLATDRELKRAHHAAA